MKIQVQSIHFDADIKLLDFLQKKLDKLETFSDKIIGAEVYFKLEPDSKANKVVQIKLNIPGHDMIVKEQCATFEEAIDKNYDVLKNMLTKQKDKAASYN